MKCCICLHNVCEGTRLETGVKEFEKAVPGACGHLSVGVVLSRHLDGIALEYCRTGNFRGHDIFADCRKINFADMIFSRIGTYSLTIYYAFLVNKSLKSYSRT